ncbi:MAG: HlyD family efflux transporter periplasmic adaptor subunit, partial [Gammaproteobacteria bacterium]|nr:HlyD family efflux transporter periplasmic adaptor subunit [Gammaproteobacteria bacterium]
MPTLFANFLDWLSRVPRKRLFPVVAVLLTVLTATALVAFAPQPDLRPAESQAIPVTSLVAAVGRRSPEIRLYGRVETPNTARLTALVTAPVESLRVREGDRAARGDVLVQLDGTDTALLIRRRESDLVDARASLDALKLAGADDREVLAHQEELHRLASEKVTRYRRLREQRSIAEETLKAVLEEHHAQAIALSRQRRLVGDFEHRLASAEAHVERALASLEEARVAHERTRIRAPFPGRVTRIPVAPGELVSPGTIVAEIYDDSALEIRVQIPNVHLPAVQGALAAGDRPAVIADLGDRQARGELERLVGAVGTGQSGVDGLVRLAADAAQPDLGRAVSLTVTLPPVAGVVSLPVLSRPRRAAS